MTGEVPAAVRPAPEVTGVLRLVFRRRGRTTYLAEQHVRAPFRIVRPFVQDDGSALLQYGHVGPGLMGGDAYALDVTVEPGAHAILMATSATRLHRMAPGVSARQQVRCTVMDGGTLEYYPGFDDPVSAGGVHSDRGGDRRFRREIRDARNLGNGTRGARRVSRVSAAEQPDDGGPRRGTVLLRRDRTVAGVRGVRVGRARGPSIPRRGLLARARGAASRGHRGARPDACQRPPTTGDLYLRALAMDGPRLRAALSAMLGSQRAAWGLSPIAFGSYTGTVDPAGPSGSGP